MLCAQDNAIFMKSDFFSTRHESLHASILSGVHKFVQLVLSAHSSKNLDLLQSEINNINNETNRLLQTFIFEVIFFPPKLGGFDTMVIE